MDPIRKIPKKFNKKSGNKVINRQYFCRKTGLKSNLTYPTNLNVGHAHVRSHGRTGHATLSYLSKHSFRQTLI